MQNSMNCLSAVKIVQNMMCLILVIIILTKHNNAEYDMSNISNIN